jgi:hypothetical protein
VTRATSVVKGLDIKGVVTADLAVAQIFLEHAVDDGPTLIAFGRSHFVNLKVNSKPISVVINRRLIPPDHVADNDVYDEHAVVQPKIKHAELWKVAEEQTSAFRGLTGLPAWALARHGSLSGRLSGATDHVLCSIVDRIEGSDPLVSYGHAIDVPGVGRFFFGELVLHDGSLQLTMVRAELGCDTTGTVSAATAKTNGTTWPPSH